MVVGVFLRNYKIYDGIKFVPISYGEKFTSYFGQNGIGKSSILESLDTFFNNREWNIFNRKSSGYMNDAYIVPLFLIKKTEISNKNKNLHSLLEKLSDFFWNAEDLKSSSSEMSFFLDFRKKLKEYLIDISQYFFFAVGIRNTNDKVPYFGVFQHIEGFLEKLDIEKSKNDNQTERAKEDDELIAQFFAKNNVLANIRDLYSYIYIPADIDIKTYTKLETENMQKLMHKNVSTAISDAIGQDKLSQINNSLDTFLAEISKKLVIYTYEKNSIRQNKITMSDFVQKIIESYFSTKVITKKDSKISIDDMSSGEKHQAIIDVCYAFLNDTSEHDKKIILAIDEPELSLHISACYEQFEKLKEISKKNHQVILTTHWYGFLPVVDKGIAHNIYLKKNNDRCISSYNLERMQEEISINRHKKILPDDIYLKSKYDFIQSVISSIRCDNFYNYIFVEGYSDKIYIESFLSDFIKQNNLRIIPLGGCKEVTSIMRLINTTIDERKDSVAGKILGLIDTDEQMTSVEWKDNDSFILRRFLFNDENGEVELVNVSSDKVFPPTEIEDALDADVFLDVIRTFPECSEFSFLSEENKSAVYSYNAIDYRDSERKKIKDFFNITGNKVKFAKIYVTKLSEAHDLKWIKSIKDFFCKNNANS